jgi:hypothetical protein
MLPPEIARRIDQELRETLRPWQTGETEALAASLEKLGPRRLAFPDFLLGALAVGGFGFAMTLAERAAGGLEAGSALLGKTLLTALKTHGPGLARRLRETHGLTVDDASLLETLQSSALLLSSEGADLDRVVSLALGARRWDAALHGLRRIVKLAGEHAHPFLWARQSICLHHLGRLEEASAAIEAGRQRAMQVRAPGSEALAVVEPLPEPPPEDVILAGWREAGCAEDAPPKVSVLVITYNHVRYIDDTLHGILNQRTQFPFEVLIHDDASPDGTADRVRYWHARYPRLIRPILRTENGKSRGIMPVVAMLPHAVGELVALCEGDDFWTREDKLQRQADFLSANPDFSCTGHNYVVFSELSMTGQIWREGREARVIQGRELANLSMLWWMPWTLTLMARRAAMRFPPVRSLAPLGDQFTMSMLGLHGHCMYFEDFIAGVRRENAFSEWSPLTDKDKEIRRLRTWMALCAYHVAEGQQDPVQHLTARLFASKLPPDVKSAELSQFLFRLKALNPNPEPAA